MKLVYYFGSVWQLRTMRRQSIKAECCGSQLGLPRGLPLSILFGCSPPGCWTALQRGGSRPTVAYIYTLSFSPTLSFLTIVFLRVECHQPALGCCKFCCLDRDFLPVKMTTEGPMSEDAQMRLKTGAMKGGLTKSDGSHPEPSEEDVKSKGRMSEDAQVIVHPPSRHMTLEISL